MSAAQIERQAAESCLQRALDDARDRAFRARMTAMGLRVKPPLPLSIAARPERIARARLADAAYRATGEHQQLTAPLDPETLGAWWRTIERASWQFCVTLADGYAPDFALERVRAWLAAERLDLEPSLLDALLDIECERALRDAARAA